SLRPRERGRRRDGRRDGRVAHRWRAEPRTLEDGPPPVWQSVPQPALHARPNRRGLLDVLRHPLSQRRARGGPAAPPLPPLLATHRAWRLLRREVGLGATKLVR